MKKVLFTEEQIQQIINYYTIDIMGMASIGLLFNVSRGVIKKLLNENNIQLDTPGQRYKGGRQVSHIKYREKHKDKLKIYYQNWSTKNRAKLREYHQSWRDNNREHVNKKSREWINNKLHTDIQFKINQTIRTALWQNLKENNVLKYQRTFEILPFTLSELMNHLESLFTPEMSWENYGEWHIDHKIPMITFHFTTTDDLAFIECWSLTNLQPMWATKRIINGIEYNGNLNKGSRFA